MKAVTAAGLVVGALLFAAPAGAQHLNTGIDYLPACKAVVATGKATTSHEGACLGVIDAVLILSNRLPRDQKFCAPSSFLSSQVTRIVVKYLEDHPARLHELFPNLVLEAIRNAWPCKQ
jgi:hypothetical protein